ncbi:MAG: response regulator transcription factor [Ruminococcus sp.]|nr:response regulator transcription factor [Ruminococcus sp.]
MSNILIVDDDKNINDMLSEALENEGYNVTKAYSGTEALRILTDQRPDLLLLDLMLPGLSGEEILQRTDGIPIIVVSAKVDVSDKVKLLLSGASDYITKPFDMQELLARITVQLRHAENPDSRHLLTFADMTMDTESHLLTVNGENVRLTRTEYAILKILMQKQGQVAAKLTILERISSDTPDCTEDSLKIHIHNLRRKLKAAGGKEYITAVWGIGFMLADLS